MPELKQRVWMPLVFLIGASFGIAGMYVYLQQMHVPVNQQSLVPESPQKTDSPTSTGAEEASSTMGGDTSYSDASPLDGIKQEPELMEITWTKPKKVDVPKTLGIEFDENGVAQIAGDMWATPTAYDLGYVGLGDYKGFHLLKWQREEAGLGTYQEYTDVLISPDGKRKVVSTQGLSEETQKWFSEKGFETKNVSYKKTKPLNELTLQNGKVLHLQESDPRYTNFGCTQAACDIPVQGTAKEGIKYYFMSDDIVRNFGPGEASVIVYDADGSAYIYNSLPVSMLYKDDQTNSVQGVGANFKGSAIQWDTDLGQANTWFNPAENSGCGSTGMPALVEASVVNAAGGVEKVGTIDGEAVYRPKKPADHPLVKHLLDMWYTGDDQKSMGAFLEKYPVPLLITKDIVGRWMQIANADVIPAAECGKPVIYLYPETKTNVSVRLPHFVDVTVSEPTYPRQGWDVIANPDGKLEYADGKTYGSLYWEGTGIAYQKPSTGWVVKGSELESFLGRTLAQYGLNQKESQDFKDFWLPIMQKYALVRISFLTDDWSKAAPLSVSPRPKTAIRLFMDWQPISQEVRLQAPVVRTPVREGFTLVEWGGTLYR